MQWARRYHGFSCGENIGYLVHGGLSVINDALVVLLITTFIVAATHTLSPDHWFGFVMLGRTRKWGIPRTLTVAGIAGIGHVGTSVILSLVAIWAGAALAHNFASIAEIATGWAMIIFGVGFAMYAYLKGGHSHHGIPFVNKIFSIDNREAEDLMHVHDHCGHDHDHDYNHGHDHGHNYDDDHDQDHHYDDHDGKKGTQLEAGYGLVAIIALTPCVLLIPLALRAGEIGMAAVVWTIVVFFVATMAAILILVAASLKGLQVIRFEFFEKFGEVITGLMIGFLGVMVVAGFI